MNLHKINIFLAIIIFLISTISCTTYKGYEKDNIHYSIYGGPKGGSFKPISEGISKLAKNIGLDLRSMGSNGSIENIRRVNSKTNAFAIAYASHVYPNVAEVGGLQSQGVKGEVVVVYHPPSAEQHRI